MSQCCFACLELGEVLPHHQYGNPESGIPACTLPPTTEAHLAALDASRHAPAPEEDDEPLPLEFPDGD